MNCPQCKGDSSQVIDSKASAQAVRRRRKCDGCSHRWTTYEFSREVLGDLIDGHGTIQPTIADLQRSVVEWAKATFPDQTVDGKAHHLHREAFELIQTPGDLIEQADCLNLLVQINAMTGHTARDMVNAGFHKLAICKERTWPSKPDLFGVYQHIKTHD